MNDLPGDLTGSNPLVPWLNKLKAAVARRTLLPGTGYERKETTGGVILRVKPGGPGGGGETGIAMFQVRAVGPNYLTCREWDGAVAGGSDVLVAKAVKLRHRAQDVIQGITLLYSYEQDPLYPLVWTRVVGDSLGGAVERQIIVPSFLPNDIIFAVELEKTGVANTTHQDLNVDGRMWARSFRTPLGDI